MPKAVRVEPADLMVSAATVDAHADGMWAKHGAADGRIEGAVTGVPTGSALALSAAVVKWQADSTVLFGRLVDHSQALRTGAAVYEQTDQQSAAAIDAVADATRAVDLGL